MTPAQARAIQQAVEKNRGFIHSRVDLRVKKNLVAHGYARVGVAMRIYVTDDGIAAAERILKCRLLPSAPVHRPTREQTAP